MIAFELYALIALAGVAWIWFDAIKAREIGMTAARASCAREGVQLLDETVVCRSTRLARDENGRVALRRVYDFEYSGSGNDRFRGSVMLVGKEVTMLDVSAHRAHEPGTWALRE
ncbi:MAG TPA: DUF3301 domain-containing protein [Rhodocyclaceae bacterium]|nr:DUF3301 domain-containing protein [Rhodocyclaceae bacterium]